LKIRIKFSKQGSMKFIGHLDLLRYFQKAIRRSGIPICYSGGYSPHQIMSFASPLGVGITSRGEYMDIETEDITSLNDMKDRLNAVMAEGIEILSCRLLHSDSKNAMSIVAAADYTLRFRNGYEPADIPDFFRKLQDFAAKESLVVWKKTKKNEKEVDIKPMIYELCIHDCVIYMQLAAGSTNNLKPELVMKAFYTYLVDIELSPFTFEIQREELYANLGDEIDRKFITLEELGE